MSPGASARIALVTLQILLTNDDGIDAPGIAVLRRALDGLGAVTTIAPDRNTSGVARGITIRRALRLQRRTFGDGYEGLACDGMPSDCVRIALLGVRCPVPDLVVSGINAGGNMGADATYSGTVGAAFEAALRGHPALAFSVEQLEPGWLDEAVPILRAMVGHVIERGLPRHSILNINLPDRPLAGITGIRPARLGGASAYDYVFLAEDETGPAGEHYLACEHPASGDWVDTDFDVVASGAVAVTPLRYDLLDPDLLADLASWDLDLERLRDQ
jgi:5'-nucleotidase